MINEQDIIFDEISNEVFLYLEELKESGEINMYESPRYVAETFEVSKSMSRKLVTTWMQSYNKKEDNDE
tara:strand:+ start:77 stop:283 length:207 start_codon:yes stop_codon:yes gene_type:complete